LPTIEKLLVVVYLFVPQQFNKLFRILREKNQSIKSKVSLDKEQVQEISNPDCCFFSVLKIIDIDFAVKVNFIFNFIFIYFGCLSGQLEILLYTRLKRLLIFSAAWWRTTHSRFLFPISSQRLRWSIIQMIDSTISFTVKA